MDEKKPDLWHSSSRPPSASSHFSSLPLAHSSASLAAPPISQHHHHHPQQPVPHHQPNPAAHPQPLQLQHQQHHNQQAQLQQHHHQHQNQQHHQQSSTPQHTNLLYGAASSDPQASPRMVSAMPTRAALPEDAPTAGATLAAPNPFGALPLLDAPDHMLPPILPAKRGYPSEDATPSNNNSNNPIQTAPMSMPADWTQHAMPNKMRVMRGLQHPSGQASAAYALPRSGGRSSHNPDSQHASLHAMRQNSLAMSGAPPTDFPTRMPGTSAGYALVKHSDVVYGGADGGPVDATAFRGAGEAKQQVLHDALSRPMGYSDALGALPGVGGAGPFLGGSLSGPHSFLAGTSSAPRGRRVSPCDDSFVIAAETGARAQCAVDNASGDGVFETYELGITIVQSSKLYANQRRSNRLLPGGSDSTTAACYMIGGTPDSVLSPLLARVSPCDPREERCKAVERVLKDKTRGAICALNGENPREARADNLAAVRICEVVADILVAFSSKRLFENRKQLFATVERQEATIKELSEQLEEQKRQTERWRKEALELGVGRGGEAAAGGGDAGGGVGGGGGGDGAAEPVGSDGRDAVTEENKGCT